MLLTMLSDDPATIILKNEKNSLKYSVAMNETKLEKKQKNTTPFLLSFYKDNRISTKAKKFF